MASAPKGCELTFFRAVWSGLADWQRSMCMMMAPMVALACTGCNAQVRLLHRSGFCRVLSGAWGGREAAGQEKDQQGEGERQEHCMALASSGPTQGSCAPPRRAARWR